MKRLLPIPFLLLSAACDSDVGNTSLRIAAWGEDYIEEEEQRAGRRLKRQKQVEEEQNQRQRSPSAQQDDFFDGQEEARGHRPGTRVDYGV